MTTPETKPLDIRALPPDVFLSERQLAAATGMTGAFYRKQRHRGTGPKFTQLSERNTRYRVRDVLEWLDNGLQSQTFSNMERNPAGITPQRRKMLAKAGKTSQKRHKAARQAAAV